MNWEGAASPGLRQCTGQECDVVTTGEAETDTSWESVENSRGTFMG